MENKNQNSTTENTNYVQYREGSGEGSYLELSKRLTELERVHRTVVKQARTRGFIEGIVSTIFGVGIVTFIVKMVKGRK